MWHRLEDPSCLPGHTAVVVLRPLSLGASSHFGATVLHQTTGVLSNSVFANTLGATGLHGNVPNLQGQVAVALSPESALRKIFFHVQREGLISDRTLVLKSSQICVYREPTRRAITVDDTRPDRIFVLSFII